MTFTRPLTAITMLLFAFSTAHVSLVLRQLLEAFIWGEPGTASAYFGEQHKPLPNTKLILYSLNVRLYLSLSREIFHCLRFSLKI